MICGTREFTAVATVKKGTFALSDCVPSQYCAVYGDWYNVVAEGHCMTQDFVEAKFSALRAS
jgi:hypothetical protein